MHVFKTHGLDGSPITPQQHYAQSLSSVLSTMSDTADRLTKQVNRLLAAVENYEDIDPGELIYLRRDLLRAKLVVDACKADPK